MGLFLEFGQYDHHIQALGWVHYRNPRPNIELPFRLMACGFPF